MVIGHRNQHTHCHAHDQGYLAATTQRVAAEQRDHDGQQTDEHNKGYAGYKGMRTFYLGHI